MCSVCLHWLHTFDAGRACATALTPLRAIDYHPHTIQPLFHSNHTPCSRSNHTPLRNSNRNPGKVLEVTEGASQLAELVAGLEEGAVVVLLW